MNLIIRKRLLFISLLLTIALVFGFSLSLNAAGYSRVQLSSSATEWIILNAGNSIILESPATFAGVNFTKDNIVSYKILNPRSIMLNGKALGITTLTLKDSSGREFKVVDIEVVPNVSSLKEHVHKMFPNEKDIRITSTKNNLILSGTVSNSATLSQVLELASAYAPQGKDEKSKIINLLEVGGVHQVMLEVRVSEMSRTLARRLGINFSVLSSSGRQFGLSLLDNLVNLPSEGWPGNPLEVTTSVNAIASFLQRGDTWTVFVDALKENGLLKVLAEPTLITMSGKQAKFLAGGEYPIPVPQSGSDNVTIEYREYGVGLNFTPTVLSSGKISMEVAPEVSQLDFSNAVAFQGFVIPGLTTRRVSTTVELADGQSFAIAGLLKEEVRENIRKFPLLGDLPVLGPLFRSSSFQKSESELIVIVTPRLVKPLDMAKQTLPTDQFVEPNDFEFYLLGQMEGTWARQPADTQGQANLPPLKKETGLDGKFGHITP